MDLIENDLYEIKNETSDFPTQVCLFVCLFVAWLQEKLNLLSVLLYAPG